MRKQTSEPTGLWGQLASRAGVEPKKLALLVSVAGGAIVLLGAKTLLGGPAKAGATDGAAAPAAAGTGSPAPASAAGASAAAPMAAPSKGAEVGAAAKSADDAAVIEVHLDTQPRRDPFAPFIEKPKASKRTGADAPADASLTPPDLSLFQLRATMDGEWVVVNDQTLRVGDTVGLGADGTPIKLVEVGHRRAAIEWRGKRFELSFQK